MEAPQEQQEQQEQQQQQEAAAEAPAAGPRRGPRPRPEPVVHTIDADLSVSLSRPLVPALLAELVKHLQYSRGQCHAPVDRLAAAYTAAAAEQQDSKRRRVATGLRRTARYLQQLGGLLDALHALPLEPLLSSGAPVALLLGASPLRPREVYCVRFAAEGWAGGGGGGGGGDGPAAAAEAAPLPPERAREISNAGKRLLRSVIVEGAAFDEWADVCAPTVMSLMVQAPAGRPPHPGFLPRRGFSLNLRKAFQVNINVQLKGGDLGGSDQQHPHHASTQQHHHTSTQHHHHHQQQQQQSLEEQLETSMQLCDSDSGSEYEEARETAAADESVEGGGWGEQRLQQQGRQQEGAEGGGPPQDPGELVWFQCSAAVKGMPQLRQADGG